MAMPTPGRPYCAPPRPVLPPGRRIREAPLDERNSAIFSPDYRARRDTLKTDRRYRVRTIVFSKPSCVRTSGSTIVKRYGGRYVDNVEAATFPIARRWLHGHLNPPTIITVSPGAVFISRNAPAFLSSRLESSAEWNENFCTMKVSAVIAISLLTFKHNARVYETK